MCVARTFDRLDRRVGADLHVRRAVQGGSRVASRHGGDGGEHVVLDKGTREDDAYAQVNALLDDVDQLVDILEVGRRKVTRGTSLLETIGPFGRRLVVIVCGIEDLRKGIVLLGGLSLAGDERSDVEVDTASGLSGAAGVQGLLELDVHETVALLVVDEEVHVVWRERLVLGEDRGRSHAVELAHLRRPLQHLDAVLVIRDLKLHAKRTKKHSRRKKESASWYAIRSCKSKKRKTRRIFYRHRSEDAEAAEAAGLEASLAGLKVGDGALAALHETDLLLGGEREVEQHRRRHDQDVGSDAVTGHAVLANLDGLVEATAFLLGDTVHADLVLHGLAERALGTESLRHLREEKQRQTRETLCKLECGCGKRMPFLW